MEPFLELAGKISKIPRIALEKTPPAREERQAHQDAILARYITNELPQAVGATSFRR